MSLDPFIENKSSAPIREANPQQPLPAFWLWVSLIVLAALAIGLRVAVLDSDPYARISWSTALLTDEGYYIHNARNVVLFGTARTDGFNNMLIMPTLHALQVVVFTLLGVGAVQARLISVFASLLALPLFYASLNRVFGRNIALVGTIFLSLDHISLFYNRMALMDTPAVSLVICSLYALIRGLPEPRKSPVLENNTEPWKIQNRELAWLFACGALLGLSFATRGLTALVMPCFLFALWHGTRALSPASRRQYHNALLAGLASAAIIFMIVWYMPHSREIAAVNHYYIADLLLPRSLPRLGYNILNGLFDYHRGTMPYLMRHSPVQCAAATTGLAWVIATGIGKRSEAPDAMPMGADPRVRAMLGLLAGWVGIYCLFLCCVSYAPSRYNILFYPALAAVAAYALIEAPRVAGEIVERKMLMALLGSFLLCLFGQVVRYRIALIDVRGMSALFCGLSLAFLAGSRLQRPRTRMVRQRYAGGTQPPEIWITGLAVWAVVNVYWTGDWLLHLSYRQKAADHWLTVHLPANSTLIGDVAPGLCLNNKFKTINVIPGLANDGPVIDQCQPPRYIVILDGEKWRETWWDERYPELVSPQRRIHTFHNLLRVFLEVGIYSVDPPGAQKPPRLFLKR